MIVEVCAQLRTDTEITWIISLQVSAWTHVLAPRLRRPAAGG